jgi:enoyl-[acyl-carrier-protein] reductase (NADH)
MNDVFVENALDKMFIAGIKDAHAYAYARVKPVKNNGKEITLNDLRNKVISCKEDIINFLNTYFKNADYIAFNRAAIIQDVANLCNSMNKNSHVAYNFFVKEYDCLLKKHFNAFDEYSVLHSEYEKLFFNYLRISEQEYKAALINQLIEYTNNKFNKSELGKQFLLYDVVTFLIK